MKDTGKANKECVLESVNAIRIDGKGQPFNFSRCRMLIQKTGQVMVQSGSDVERSPVFDERSVLASQIAGVATDS